MYNKKQRKNSQQVKQDLIDYCQQSFYQMQLSKIDECEVTIKKRRQEHKRRKTEVLPDIIQRGRRLKTIEDHYIKQNQLIYSKDYRYGRNVPIKKINTDLQKRQDYIQDCQLQNITRNSKRSESRISYSTAINRRSLLSISPVNLGVFPKIDETKKKNTDKKTNVDKKYKPSIISYCIPKNSPFHFKVKALPQIHKIFRFRQQEKPKAKKSLTKVLIIQDNPFLMKKQHQLLFEDCSFR